MLLSDLAALGSFVSGIAVLISLVYLGLQVRQSSLDQRATAHQSVQEFMRQHQRMLMDSELACIFSRGLSADASMTEVELMQFHAMVRDWLSFHNECFWLNARRVLDEDGLKTADNGLRVLLRYPGFRAAWQLSRFSFDKAYRARIDAEAQTALSHGVPLSVPALLVTGDGSAESQQAIVETRIPVMYKPTAPAEILRRASEIAFG